MADNKPKTIVLYAPGTGRATTVRVSEQSAWIERGYTVENPKSAGGLLGATKEKPGQGQPKPEPQPKPGTPQPPQPPHKPGSTPAPPSQQPKRHEP